MTRLPPMQTTVLRSDGPVSVHVDHAQGRWFRLYAWVVKTGVLSQLSGSASKILMAIGYFAAQGDNKMAYPSISTLMSATGYGRSTTIDALKELVDAKVLRRRGDGGGNSTTIYELVEHSSSSSDGVSHEQPTPPPPSRILDRSSRLDPPVQSGGPLPPTPRPESWTGPVQRAGPHLEEENQSSSSRDGAPRLNRLGGDLGRKVDAAAAAALKAQGFSEAECERLAAFGIGRVADAIESAIGLERDGKARWTSGKGSRRGYIAKFIGEGYSLYEGVDKHRKATMRPKLLELGQHHFGWNHDQAVRAVADALKFNYVRWEDFHGAEPAAIVAVWKQRAEEHLGVRT